MGSCCKCLLLHEDADAGRVSLGEHEDNVSVDSPSAKIDEMLKMPFSRLDVLTRFIGFSCSGATRWEHMA